MCTADVILNHETFNRTDERWLNWTPTEWSIVGIIFNVYIMYSEEENKLKKIPYENVGKKNK